MSQREGSGSSSDLSQQPSRTLVYSTRTEAVPSETPTDIVQSTTAASELESAFAFRSWRYAKMYFRLSPLADSTEVCIDAVSLLSSTEEAGVVVRGS